MAPETSSQPVEDTSAIELNEIREPTLFENPPSGYGTHEVAEQISDGREDPSRPPGFFPLRNWWSHNVCPTVSHDPQRGPSLSNRDARDYLALERTYLAHIRTANAVASFGVVLFQLFRLKNVNTRAGLALGAVTACGATIMVLAAGYRFFFQQRNLLRGRVVIGGPRDWLDWAIVVSVVVAVLVVVLVVN
ncbi:MAG: hypothetical protein Q9218_005763 [Villophora microphyllina]